MVPGASDRPSGSLCPLSADPDLQTARHSLAWLVAANCVGVLLAAMLIYPPINHLLAPLTYGRWMPVHLNLQLYGWCALPLVGLLFRFYSAPGDPLAPRLRRLALAVWSGALAIGAITWLGGTTSGKVFLDWHGPDRLIFSLALGFLWATVFVMYRRRQAMPAEDRLHRITRPLLLGVLAFVPPVMYLVSSRAVYPAINPDSGGPTGVSLLGSSLGLVLIFIYLPWLLGRRPISGHLTRGLSLLYAAHLAVFLLLSHGDATNGDPIQVVALASVGIWVPLLIAHFRRFDWPRPWRLWLLAFALWSAYLVISAVGSFLPGVLNHLKFTNALVAHSHAAMAGVLSAFNILVLLAIAEDRPLARALTSPTPFQLWQTGLVVYVLSMTFLGIQEGDQPGILFRQDFLASALYLIRLAAGALMLGASITWLRGTRVPARQPATAPVAVMEAAR